MKYDKIRNFQHWLVPFLFIIFFSVHAWTLGPSDDEAYYWVLSEKLRFGYAFHPPMVAWMIAISRFFFESFLPPVVVLRLPVIISLMLIFLVWERLLGLMKIKVRTQFWAYFISYAGFFAACFMIVPDIPLFLGLTLMMGGSWNYFVGRKMHRMDSVMIVCGITFSFLAKYSAVLWLPSLLFIAVVGHREERSKYLRLCIISGVFAGIILLLGFWQNGFGSLLYQISERHSGMHFQILRFLRFMVLQLIITGPVVLLFGRAFSKAMRSAVNCFKKHNQISDESQKFIVEKATLYGVLFGLPPIMIFGLQPAFSDFKIHWVFAGIYPIFVLLGFSSIDAKSDLKWVRWQSVYGIALGLFLVLATHYPLLSLIQMTVLKNELNPLHDVSNDLVGYESLKDFFDDLPIEEKNYEIIGGRYQTASQAFFALNASRSRRDAKEYSVTMFPVSQKERGEWTEQKSLLSDANGATILKPFFWITDDRYGALPDLRRGTCQEVFVHQPLRLGNIVGKSVHVYRCGT